MAMRWYFKSLQKGFNQLYNIHGQYKWDLYPCVFALLTGKDINDYKAFLRQLKEGALRHRLILKPEKLMIDFEAAFMKAYHFPNAQIMGCFFHFGQNIIRNIHTIG